MWRSIITVVALYAINNWLRAAAPGSESTSMSFLVVLSIAGKGCSLHRSGLAVR
jgi:hypothetical protein